jgi:hypothetical protein
MVATVTIDGRRFRCSSVQITERGQVLIDGAMEEDTLHGRVEIHVIEGTLENLEVAGDVHCGAVGGDVDAGGSITCGDVGGDVDAGTSVTCGAVRGDVDAGTSVTCGDVGGSIDAGGEVTIHRQS